MFERSGDVKKGLKLGKRERIHQWFKEWAPYDDYEIKDDLSVYIKGHLDLENSQVTQLPKDLSVGGDLDLINSQVTQLPENLSVEGHLDLEDSQVTHLPKNLSIGGDIYINEDQNIEVPENLKHKIVYL
jgi:hypothetical protein